MLLYQPQEGYCYNSDSLFLYDFINTFRPKGRVLDVGAGCGVVGLLVARDNAKVKLEGVEKQEKFAEYAAINARVNKIEYTLHRKDFIEFDESLKYDYIISNPPFYHDGVTKSKNEMLLNARYNTNLPLDRFFQKVARVLKPKSHFIFCYDASQFGIVCSELDKANMKAVDVEFVHSKKDRAASLVMVHARNDSNSLMKIRPPFIGFEGNAFSQKAQDIYKKARTQSIKCHI